jgi:hypothetical protein
LDLEHTSRTLDVELSVDDNVDMKTTTPTQISKGAVMAKHTIISVEAKGPSELGALGGYVATCSCGHQMSHSLGEREARNLGIAHANFMNSKGA